MPSLRVAPCNFAQLRGVKRSGIIVICSFARASVCTISSFLRRPADARLTPWNLKHTPLPLAPIIAALYLGGTLVPHAAGGLSVTAAGGSGYVAGTYLSTTAIVSIVTLMSAGLIASTPLWIPVAAGTAAAGGVGGVVYFVYCINRIKSKSTEVILGQEAPFSEREAKLVQSILLALHKRNGLSEA